MVVPFSVSATGVSAERPAASSLPSATARSSGGPSSTTVTESATEADQSTAGRSPRSRGPPASCSRSAGCRRMPGRPRPRSRPGRCRSRCAALWQASASSASPLKVRRVAVHEAHDESAAGRLGGLDDELGAHRVGQRLAVVAVTGVDDLDVGAAVPGDDALAGDLVDDDDVGGGEELDRAHGHQAGVARAGADEGDAARLAGRSWWWRVGVVVEREGLTVHAPCCWVLGCGRGRRADGLRSPRLGLGASRRGRADGGSGARARRGAGAVLEQQSAPDAGRWTRRRATGPTRERRRSNDPSTAPTNARSDSSRPSSPSTTSASAPTGAEQPGLEGGEQGALGRDGRAGVGVVERAQQLDGRRGRRSGTRRRARPDRARAASAAGRAISATSSSRPRRASPARASTTASTAPSRARADPGVDVAPDVLELEPETERGELGHPARGPGADHGALAAAHRGPHPRC